MIKVKRLFKTDIKIEDVYFKNIVEDGHDKIKHRI